MAAVAMMAAALSPRDRPGALEECAVIDLSPLNLDAASRAARMLSITAYDAGHIRATNIQLFSSKDAHFDQSIDKNVRR
ncbi:hypothetical protein AS189_00140 [Arthrobacter alpinus]|uniref:Uncharacterized protein n=1 Tax=Arthrobacter alpinus TaxID=656366 RepID=A0A0S2LUX9_9MICC|nr:hypothetical protein AS189_00140 [Arthrobacter alpinus]